MLYTDVLRGAESYFLGASGPAGFHSLFGELYDPAAGWRLTILKGGPGTGKSTLLRRFAETAEQNEHSVERIFCSSDPDSLDAVIVPALRLSMADGTAPHVLEPRYPGVSEAIFDLGQARDDARLTAHTAEILRLTDENAAAHKRCAAFLKAAAAAADEGYAAAAQGLDEARALSWCAKTAAAEFGAPAAPPGRIRRRFLTALTPKGVATFTGTVAAACPRVWALDDPAGPAAALALARLAALASAAGLETVRCPSYLFPERLSQLLVPALGLAVCTADRAHALPLETERRIDCRRFYVSGALAQTRHRRAFCRRAANELLDAALERMQTAKTLHDELERYYTAAMDFGALAALAARCPALALPRN